MNLVFMNRTYLLDEITKIRRVIIEKSGKFTLKECESIAAALEVDNVSLVAMLEAIRKDLFPQKFVLNLKDANAFNFCGLPFRRMWNMLF